MIGSAGKTGDAMTDEQARHQALAASGAALITFIGVCHEVVGEALFPWGPAFMGGPAPWHAMGVLCALLGVLLLAGSLRLIRVRVVVFALLPVIPALAIAAYTALAYGRFHLFALTLAGAGALTAWAHHKATRPAAP